ncbi:hypothetical protein [Burkholderia pseudomallei]|uniref:hypothetical protein n=1 Tax=Burkholderia pseudomallei TaxID=28450 RepID=UPI0012F488C5|nr:hypothetical protein [Burkholderia pseudomallei]
MKEEGHEKVFARLDEARQVMTDFKDRIRGEQHKRDDAAFRAFMDKVITAIRKSVWKWPARNKFRKRNFVWKGQPIWPVVK